MQITEMLTKILYCVANHTRIGPLDQWGFSESHLPTLGAKHFSLPMLNAKCNEPTL